MTDLSALIEELERASAGSRELDDLIMFVAVDVSEVRRQEGKRPQFLVPACYCEDGPPYHVDGAPHWRQYEGGMGGPHYTTSLDAALTLVPDGCSVLLALGHFAQASVSIGTVNRAKTKWIGDGASPTAPLALCIAALKARQAMERSDG